MRTLIAAAGLVVVAAVADAQQSRWYVAQVYGEPCVPLDDIDDNPPFGRLYYGNGTMHTPEDFVKLYARYGIGLREVSVPHAFAGTREFVTPDGKTAIMLFDNERLCRAVMATVPR